MLYCYDDYPLPFLYHFIKCFTPFPEPIVQPICLQFLHFDKSLDNVFLLFSPITFPIVQVLCTGKKPTISLSAVKSLF